MKIGIIGCGWLGLPLAKELIRRGHQLSGTTTKEEKITQLKASQIDAHLVNLTIDLQAKIKEDLWQQNCLIITIPPAIRQGRSCEDYLAKIDFIIQKANEHEIDKIIFTSSTSVYGMPNKIVYENDDCFPERAAGVCLQKVEALIRDKFDGDYVIFRLAGLIGAYRHPGRFLAGKKLLKNPDSPINLVHLKDLLSIIPHLIEKEGDLHWNQIINLVNDEHPTRKDFYGQMALALDLESPTFDPAGDNKWKIVSNNRLKSYLPKDFQFINMYSSSEYEFVN